MLDRLTHARFAGYLNQRFRLRLDGATLSLELITVESFPVREEVGSGAIRRQGFSLVFRGPKEPLLPQAIYTLEHEGVLGALPIFLVPIEPDAQGSRYEAVFN
jgi:hypothetical protein